MTKKITVYLDMDGTIADLYGIENWLDRLHNEDETIFTECAPLITEKELLKRFPTEKYEIRILSMTPLGATDKYCENVANQKSAWLDRYFLKGSANAILVDDSAPIRATFRGTALNPADLWG